MAGVGRPPIYPKFKKRLQYYIESPEFRPGDRLESEAELCDKFGVSRVLVRRAITELRDLGKIESIPGKGHFLACPDTKATLPGVVSVILGYETLDSPLFDPHLSKVLSGLEAPFAPTHYRMVWEKVGPMKKSVSELVKPHLAELRGVILVPLGGQTGEVMASNLPQGTKFIVVGRPSWDSQVPSVCVDYAQGTRKAIQYLLELGHKRVGIVTLDTEVGPAMIRHTAYSETLTSAGFTPDPSLTASCMRENAGQAEQAIVEMLRRERGRMTSLFVASNSLLPMTLRAINTEGLKVPDDISVVCFDDDMLAEYNVPAITAVRQPSQEMGKTGSQMLLNLLRGTPLQPNEITLPTSLLVRDSCKAVNG